MNWREELEEINPDALTLSGFDEAIIGIGSQYSKSVCVVYSEQKIIDKLAEEMSYEDAEEYYGFNIACAFMGPHTPIIIKTEYEKVA
tara:strand:+ start:55 stop:315 length:261 start_codon:yes stop_codon:yes gene_type:complete